MRRGPARRRPTRVVSLGMAHARLRAVPHVVVLAAILGDHAPDAIGPLLVEIDLAAGDAVAPQVARALLAAIRYDGFPVYAEDVIDACDACVSPGCLPAYCFSIPLGSGEAYWEEWAGDERSLPEALVAGIADGWVDAWGDRAAVAAAARDAGAAVAALVARILALEERALDAAGEALVEDGARFLAALPAPLNDVPLLAAYAAARTGNIYLDHGEEWWNQQALRGEWRWSVPLVRRLRREWAEALDVLTRLEETRRALAEPACWPSVLAAMAGALDLAQLRRHDA